MRAGDDTPENYLLLLRTMQTLIKRYNWFDTTENTNGIKLAFETMNRALLDNPLTLWEKAAENLRSNQINTENGFKKCVSELTDEICGEDAVDAQKQYMETTKKPHDLGMKEFYMKLQQMNNTLTV